MPYGLKTIFKLKFMLKMHWPIYILKYM